MYVTAIILAAGKGLRFKQKVSKPLVEINNLPVIIYSLKVLSRHPRVKDIVVVVNYKNKPAIINTINRYKIDKVKNIVLGGLRRQDSVVSGLKVIDNKTDLVLIHDAARPFIDKKMISRLIQTAQKCGAAITGVPVKATIKEAIRTRMYQDVRVKRTLNRNNLWEIQTPQVFKRDLVSKAYKRFINIEVTDDASLVEKLGAEIRIVMGSYFNIKITTPEDLVLAEAIARKS